MNSDSEQGQHSATILQCAAAEQPYSRRFAAKSLDFTNALQKSYCTEACMQNFLSLAKLIILLIAVEIYFHLLIYL